MISIRTDSASSCVSCKIEKKNKQTNQVSYFTALGKRKLITKAAGNDLVSGRLNPRSAIKQHARQALEGGVANVRVRLRVHFVNDQRGRVQQFLSLFTAALLVRG